MVAGALTACAQNGADMKKAMEMKSSEPTFETAAYFVMWKVRKIKLFQPRIHLLMVKQIATVTINRQVVGHEMKLDSTYQDGVRLVEGTKSGH